MPNCSKCNTKLETAIKLQSHWKHHCGTCQSNVYYSKLNEKYFHYSLAHKGICPICDEVGFPDLKQLHNHIKIDHRHFPCSYCWKIFTSELQLKMHSINPGMHHAFTCKSCHISFDNNIDMWNHFYQTHQPKCPLCTAVIWNPFKKMSFKIHWNSHMVKVHKLFPCENCPAVFTCSLMLEQHNIASHRSVCDICLMHFPATEDKDRHIQSAHQMKCPICDMYFGTILEFSYHYKDTHRHNCNTCQSSFPNMQALKDHEDKHVNSVANELKQCTICEDKFNYEEDLVTHYCELHTDI